MSLRYGRIRPLFGQRLMNGLVTSAAPLFTAAPTGCLLDAASERYAIMTQFDKIETYNGIVIPQTDGTAGTAVVSIRIETVDDTTNFPTGVLYHADAIGSFTCQGGADSIVAACPGSWSSNAIGDRIAIVVARAASGTGTHRGRQAVSANVNFSQQQMGNNDISASPGAWAKAANMFFCGGLRRASDNKIDALGSLVTSSGVTVQTFSESSNPDEYGFEFVAEYTFRCVGLKYMLGFSTTTNNEAVMRLHVDGVLQRSVTINSAALTTNNTRYLFERFCDPIIIRRGQTVTCTLKHNGSNNATIDRIPFADDWAMATSIGISGNAVTRNNSTDGTGAFTTLTNEAILFTAMIDAIDINSGNFGML